MENNNVGLLLNKFTKYQTLLANTHNSQKINVYRQKIKFYENKMTKLRVNQENLDGLNKLVGGVDDDNMSYETFIKTFKKNFQEKLNNSTNSTCPLYDIEQQLFTLTTNNIGTIQKNFNNIIITLNKLNNIINQEVKTKPNTCPILNNALINIKKLNDLINKTDGTIKNKITELPKIVATETIIRPIDSKK